MQRWGAVRLVLSGLLAGGLIASGATPVGALPDRTSGATLTARVGPSRVPVGEPATLSVRLRPATHGVRLAVQRRVSGRWVTVSRPRTDAHGRASVRISTRRAGVQRLRVLRSSARRPLRAVSRPVTLTVTAGSPCRPRVAAVDPLATDAAMCLAARMDRWRAATAMGVGQQLNVSTQQYAAPLTELGDRPVHVVGFDLEELAKADSYEFPFADQVVSDLTALADDGAVLVASWHADNPHTGGAYDDRGWHDLSALLDPSTAEYASFWSDFDAELTYLQRLQEAGVAVVFRPFHEANGNWFWWGHPDPATYRSVWALMQQKTWDAGVHNVLWAYSFNADTGTNTGIPVHLLPDHIDLAGLDSYSRPGAALPTTGYAAVAAEAPRMAFTEVGPYQTSDRSWDPAAVTRAARRLAVPPLWSMYWFDDPGGVKQLSSLEHGRSWLDSCRGGFCSVG